MTANATTSSAASALTLTGVPVGRPRDLSREDTTFTFPLLTRGRYLGAFTCLVKIQCRSGLMLLPDDVRTSLRDAGIMRPPEVLPDLRVSIKVPRSLILSPGVSFEPGGIPPFATAQDVLNMFPSLRANKDLAEALHQCVTRDSVVEPRVIAYATPYEGATADVGSASMYLPLRTLVRASARPGQVYSHGQGFCLFPSAAMPIAQAAPAYIPTQQLLVGLCTALRRTNNREATGHEWLGVINPLATVDADSRRVYRSIVDTIFAQLFHPDLNDLTWEEEKRPQRRGPLLQLIINALKMGSDVYEKLVVAEGDPDEEGAEATQDELRRRILKVRLCDHCKWPLRTPTSSFCIECGTPQKIVKPITLDFTKAAEAAKVVRTGPPCPHDSTHNLRKETSKHCDLCNKPVGEPPVAPEAPKAEPPVAPPKAESKNPSRWCWCTNLRGHKSAPDAQGTRCPLYHMPLFTDELNCSDEKCGRPLKGSRASDKERAAFDAAKQKAIVAIGYDPEERYLASLVAAPSSDAPPAEPVATNPASPPA